MSASNDLATEIKEEEEETIMMWLIYSAVFLVLMYVTGRRYGRRLVNSNWRRLQLITGVDHRHAKSRPPTPPVATIDNVESDLEPPTSEHKLDLSVNENICILEFGYVISYSMSYEDTKLRYL